MHTTNDLPARLLEHAAAHEELAAYYEPPAAHQAQWAKDLRDAAAQLELSRRRDIATHQDAASARSFWTPLNKNMAVIEAAYGWAIDVDGSLLGLVNGDMGYEETGIRLGGEDLEIWKRGQLAKPSSGHENGAERLCRILYGRGAEIGDTIGGLDAQMLHDAHSEIERLRKPVLPEDD